MLTYDFLKTIIKLEIDISFFTFITTTIFQKPTADKILGDSICTISKAG